MAFSLLLQRCSTLNSNPFRYDFAVMQFPLTLLALWGLAAGFSIAAASPYRPSGVESDAPSHSDHSRVSRTSARHANGAHPRHGTGLNPDTRLNDPAGIEGEWGSPGMFITEWMHLDNSEKDWYRSSPSFRPIQRHYRSKLGALNLSPDTRRTIRRQLRLGTYKRPTAIPTLTLPSRSAKLTPVQSSHV